MELLSRKGGQRDCPLELVSLVAKHTEEVNYLTIDVVVSLDWRWPAI